MHIETLNERLRQIFRRIVESCLETGEPVRAHGIRGLPVCQHTVWKSVPGRGTREWVQEQEVS